MPVVEPKELKKRAKAREKAKKRKLRVRVIRTSLLTLVLGVILMLALKAFILNGYVSVDSNQTPAEPVEPTPKINTDEKSKARLVTFTGDQFKQLYRSVNYPNIQLLSTPPEITANDKADERIRELAEKRGFMLTSIPVSPISQTNEPLLVGSDDDLLQPLALKAWQALKKQASDEGIPLQLISAYRSIERQRELFTSRLFETGVSIQQIAAGQADDQINQTLTLTAVPGYSRHHTGYTIDLSCDDGSGNFGDSSCYQWIKSDNYEKAKRQGWIPSYPEDAKEQGPEPEPWEYVWVGINFLYE